MRAPTDTIAIFATVATRIPAMMTGTARAGRAPSAPVGRVSEARADSCTLSGTESKASTPERTMSEGVDAQCDEHASAGK